MDKPARFAGLVPSQQLRHHPSAEVHQCAPPSRSSTPTAGSARYITEDLDRIYSSQSRRILATLIRLLGDVDRAEDALQDAFAAAAEQWPRQGIPAKPVAWLVSTGRFKAIDGLRRRARFEVRLEPAMDHLGGETVDPADMIDSVVEDDRLRLVFTCCHPALSPDGRIALTLREVCGLTTGQIARAFLTTPIAIAQRIVRAKAKIRTARIPYEVPSHADVPRRLEAVLQVIYLVFNEGYSATSGDVVTRADLSGEAIRLGRLLLHLLPEPEVKGLLALMLLQESRRAARTSSTGDLVLLDAQDRSLWDRDLIREGLALVGQALGSRELGPYTLQAAIAAVHCEASTPAATDWRRIVELYDALLWTKPSPVIELNRAVAVAMRDGAESGLPLVEAILARGDLADYHLAHSVRAELCRSLGRTSAARDSFERALSLTTLEPERRLLEKRMNGLRRVQDSLSNPAPSDRLHVETQ